MTLTMLDKRQATMDLALREFDARGGRVIVETGSARVGGTVDGDGLSTVAFGEHVANSGGVLWTVDIDYENLRAAMRLTEPFRGRIIYQLGDSVSFLGSPTAPPGIDLLYLDSLDYPYGELLDVFGGREDIDRAAARLVLLSEAEIVHWFGDLIAPSQEHALAELQAALPSLHPRSLVLIDDAGLPGGGKARLARGLLESIGARLLLDGYQTLWSMT